jgi:hypothetical protein
LILADLGKRGKQAPAVTDPLDAQIKKILVG